MAFVMETCDSELDLLIREIKEAGNESEKALILAYEASLEQARFERDRLEALINRISAGGIEYREENE